MPELQQSSPISSRAPFSKNAIPAIEIAPDIFREELIVGFESHDSRSRAFNLLRSQITRHIDQTGARILGITSATPAAGKTFVSTNLAAALSQMEDRSVILCDFDLRRGSVQDILGTSLSPNLTGYLKGEIPDWTSALYRINATDFYVLPTKGSPRGSSEMLSGNRFAALIEGLRALPEDFIVLCDLPPVFANDDAMLCARQLDSYLLVVEHGRSTAAQVKESLALLQPTPCLGTVLNRYQGGFVDDYGYGYGDTYGLKDYGASD